MVKGGKRYDGMDKDGQWFAHPHYSKLGSREACTTTGIMLSETNALLPRDRHVKRYPKWKIRQGVGRKKYPYDCIQSKSYICLTHDSAEEPTCNFPTRPTDFTSAEVYNVPTKNRRFPKNHKLRSEEAFEETTEQLMWFGQDTAHDPIGLDVLVTANLSAPSRSSHI